jgi:hypothetical protein
LRRLVCHDLSLACRNCPVRPECPYPDLFESAPPPGGDRLRNYQSIPRPFVVDPPRDGTDVLPAGRSLEFALTMVGRSTRHLPYVVAAFRVLADEGLGAGRTPFALEEVSVPGIDGTRHTIYCEGRNQVVPMAPAARPADLMRPGDEGLRAVTVRFCTPTHLKDAGECRVHVGFGPLLRRLRDRAAALAAFFGDGPLDLDFKGLGELAEGVRLVDDRTIQVEVPRRSSRTGQRHDVGGLVGEARYEGAAIGPLMPLVRLGEVIHVGKHAAFGNGLLEVVE